MTTDDELLNQIYAAEETDKFIYSLREELMDRVMKECYRSYINKQTLNFTVQCAYDAMVKFLCMNFYYHAEAPDQNHAMWTPDDPIDPSPKDTWAKAAVPIRPRDLKTDSTIEEIFIGSPDSEESSEICLCINECDCLFSKQGEFRFPSTPTEKPYPSRVKFSPKSSKPVFPDIARSSKTISESMGSARRSLKNSRGTRSPDTGSKADARRKRAKSLMKEYRIEVPGPIERGSLASVVKLPPIRVNIDLASRPNTDKKKKRW